MTPREAYVRRMCDLVHRDTDAMDSCSWLVLVHAWRSVYLVGCSHEQEFAIDNGIVFG